MFSSGGGAVSCSERFSSIMSVLFGIFNTADTVEPCQNRTLKCQKKRRGSAGAFLSQYRQEAGEATGTSVRAQAPAPCCRLRKMDLS